MYETSIASRILRQSASVFAVISLLLSTTSPEAFAAPKPPKPKPSNSISIVPTIDSITVVGGQLFATGTATATINRRTTTVPFTAPVDVRLAADQTAAGACPILDLELGPITLDLLGLVVETSPICLQITAYDGGGLLGDLLCAVANLLNGGLSLDQILSGQGVLDPLTGAVLVPGLTPAQVGQLLGGIADLLNGALQNLLDAVLTQLLPGAAGQCSILHLELGPLNLNLLGLEVILDNCSEGAVTVDITGERGSGNLLGNLLCGLLGDGLIDLGSTLSTILAQILGALAG